MMPDDANANKAAAYNPMDHVRHALDYMWFLMAFVETYQWLLK
jgi:hypothetical protein